MDRPPLTSTGHPPRISTEFRRLEDLCAGESVRLRQLLGEMGPRDHAVFTLMLCAAFLHPVPMPGFSQVFGATIMFAGARMALGKGPWVPARWIDRPIPAAFLRRVFSAFARASTWFEHWVRPRGKFLAAHPGTRRLNGAGLVLVGALILVPLPPPTNFPPALAGFVLSVGAAEDDILFVSLGWGLLALNALLFGAIAVYGIDGVRALWSAL